MKKYVMQASALLGAALLFSGVSAVAQTLSSSDYSSGKTRINSEYKIEKLNCKALAGNAQDICDAQAKGKREVALAALYDSYKPSSKTRYKLRNAKADAVYAVAKQQCDDRAGNPKDVCIDQAKAERTTAKAEASVEYKTAAVNATAATISTNAQNRADNQAAEIRADANADERAARYTVEKERCDALAGVAKDNCLRQAKQQFGKL